MVPFGILSLSKPKTIYLCKTHYKKKKLNISEIFNSGIAFANTVKDYKKSQIVLKENTSKEIELAVAEMINLERKFWKIGKKELILQKKFKKIYFKNKIKFSKKFKILKTNNLFMYSNSFLKKNYWFLN